MVERRGGFGRLQYECRNYCKVGLMSRCGAGRNWKAQGRCTYSVKSTVAQRCMYFYDDGTNHCDCIKAQKYCEEFEL